MHDELMMEVVPGCREALKDANRQSSHSIIILGGSPQFYE
jgi:hypothetical protein